MDQTSMEAFMKPYKAVAALIAAGAMGAAFAAPMEPTWRAESEYKFANDPVASPLAGAADDDIIKGVVAALNEDASLKGSKITVSTDNGVVTLTGVTDTAQQAKQAVQVAAAKAGGDGNVVNVIQPAKIIYQTPQLQENQRRIDQAGAMEQG
jgi:osmotically-inducible protein OsmY